MTSKWIWILHMFKKVNTTPPTPLTPPPSQQNTNAKQKQNKKYNLFFALATG